MHMYMCIYIYIYITFSNGVHTNGAAAKEMTFVRLGKKIRPVTFGDIQVG